MRSESINAFLAVLSTEGRVVGLCWANQNLKDLKDRYTLNHNAGCGDGGDRRAGPDHHRPKEADIRLPGKANGKTYGARPVY